MQTKIVVENSFILKENKCIFTTLQPERLGIQYRRQLEWEILNNALIGLLCHHHSPCLITFTIIVLFVIFIALVNVKKIVIFIVTVVLLLVSLVFWYQI
mgnify:CR=1 FL=1